MHAWSWLWLRKVLSFEETYLSNNTFLNCSHDRDHACIHNCNFPIAVGIDHAYMTSDIGENIIIIVKVGLALKNYIAI